MSNIPLFKYLDIETSSLCNRKCPTCIRNSHPNRDKVSSWFSPNYLSLWDIYDIFDQVMQLGFTGSLCLSHYNEPTLDDRLYYIAKIARQRSFDYVWCVSNGDLMTEELAEKLDGNLDAISFSMYMDEPIKTMRGKWLESLFKKTQVTILSHSEHIATHFSPKFDVKSLAKANKNNPCIDTSHCIINHKGQYLLCCDDVVGNFDLGTIYDKSIADYWFGHDHQTIVKMLSIPGGRLGYPYCSTCPRS